MDSDLMRPSCLQTALDQGICISKMFTWPNMSDRMFTFSIICRTPSTITPVPHKTRDNSAFTNMTNSKGEVLTISRMLSKLLCQNSSSRYRSGNTRRPLVSRSIRWTDALAPSDAIFKPLFHLPCFAAFKKRPITVGKSSSRVGCN